MGPRRLIVTLGFLLAAASAQAAALPIHFTITPDKSSIAFAAEENGITVSGHFERFSGEVTFDPKALQQGSAKVEIELASVASGSENIADNLKTADWFDPAHFPTALFEAHGFTALGGENYAANGTLTLRGVSQKVTLHFTVHRIDANGATVTGEAALSRTAYKVGWKDTSNVKDAVKVTIDLQAPAAK